MVCRLGEGRRGGLLGARPPLPTAAMDVFDELLADIEMEGLDEGATGTAFGASPPRARAAMP